MRNIFCFIPIMLFSICVQSQDTTRDVKFAPGTLVGKYYGTYDTSAKKKIVIPDTRIASNIQSLPSDTNRKINTTGLSQRPQLQVNQNFNPIEISGTKQATGLNIGSEQNITNLNNQPLSSKQQLKINQNFNPIEVSGTTQATSLNAPTTETESVQAISVTNTPVVQVNKVPQTVISQPVSQTSSYRDTRLGSSSPVYNTYRTNNNGAGSITTNPNKNSGNINTSVAGMAVQPQNPPQTFYRDTRLGSSSPQYDTYKKNDDGAGSVTTNPNKSSGAIITSSSNPVLPQYTHNPAQSFYRDTRLGSSSPQYDTYKKNDDGAGSVTTNPNKSSGAIITSSSNPVVSQYTQSQTQSFYRDTRLGSSSPQYDTYKKNDNGAGSVTTNPNKAGGYYLPEIRPIQPEQAPSDSTTKAKTVTSR